MSVKGEVKMSLKKEWVKPGLRVLTPNGPGALLSPETASGFYGQHYEVELDEPVSGEKTVICHCQEGEVVVESDFSMLRVINLGFLDYHLISGVQNYPTWEECLEALKQPFSQDENLLALNFREKKFQTNRFLPAIERYNLIQCYFDAHHRMEAKFYDSKEEAKEAWKEIDKLSGTTGYIMLCCLIDHKTLEILSRAIFSRFKVIIKETWW